MEDRTIIKLENISKEYRIYKSNRQKVAHELFGFNKGIPFHALKDVNIEIKKGENVAIIGNIGSGRSTLARIISGVASPTEGTAEVEGKILPIFDMRSGFDMNFTGRDNIYMKGVMMGWSKQQVAEREEEIIRFAELDRLIDMKMKAFKPVDISRLGFSMIAVDDNDIMVFDCFLAVGNLDQRARCVAKLKEITSDENRTLVMVNNIWPITAELCTRGIVFHEGMVMYDGPLDDAIKEFRTKYKTKVLTAGEDEVHKDDHKDDQSDDDKEHEIEDF